MTFKSFVDSIIAQMSLPAKIIALALVGYVFIRSLIKWAMMTFKKDPYSDLDREVAKIKKHYK